MPIWIKTLLLAMQQSQWLNVSRENYNFSLSINLVKKLNFVFNLLIWIISLSNMVYNIVLSRMQIQSFPLITWPWAYGQCRPLNLSHEKLELRNFISKIELYKSEYMQCSDFQQFCLMATKLDTVFNKLRRPPSQRWHENTVIGIQNEF